MVGDHMGIRGAVDLLLRRPWILLFIIYYFFAWFVHEYSFIYTLNQCIALHLAYVLALRLADLLGELFGPSGPSQNWLQNGRFSPKKNYQLRTPPPTIWERPLVWSNFFRTFVMKKFDHINQKVREPITKRLLHTQFCNQNWPPTLVICNDLWENCNRSRGFKCYRRKNIVSPRRCTIERLWCQIWTICFL
jgi:hypothetical protein